MYQPRTGDTVTVTRTHPSGRTSTWTGRISGILDTGFCLTGIGPERQPCDTCLSSAAMLARYGVTQTITPT